MLNTPDSDESVLTANMDLIPSPPAVISASPYNARLARLVLSFAIPSLLKPNSSNTYTTDQFIQDTVVLASSKTSIQRGEEDRNISRKSTNVDKGTAQSTAAMIGHAILSTSEKRATQKEIQVYIAEHFSLPVGCDSRKIKNRIDAMRLMSESALNEWRLDQMDLLKGDVIGKLLKDFFKVHLTILVIAMNKCTDRLPQYLPIYCSQSRGRICLTQAIATRSSTSGENFKD